MIDTKSVSDLLGITKHRVKQILTEQNIEIARLPGKHGRIKISNKAMRAILNSRGYRFDGSTVVIGQEKGGVGKSLVTYNVATALARKGARILIIDLDPEACLTNLLIDEGVEFKTIYEILKNGLQFKDAIVASNSDGIDIVGCKGVARRAERLCGDGNPKKIISSKMSGLEAYDCILFDVPPTFSRLISSAYLASDIIVMPTFPDSWSLESIQLTIDDIEADCSEFDAKIPEIKILMNRFLSERKASKDAWSVLSESYGSYLLPFQIKENAQLQNSINDGTSIFDVRGSAEIKDAINSLANFICPLEKTEDVKNA